MYFMFTAIHLLNLMFYKVFLFPCINSFMILMGPFAKECALSGQSAAGTGILCGIGTDQVARKSILLLGEISVWDTLTRLTYL